MPLGNLARDILAQILLLARAKPLHSDLDFWQERVVRCHVDLDRAIANVSGWAAWYTAATVGLTSDIIVSSLKLKLTRNTSASIALFSSSRQ
jgi:hypothetical protein